MLRTTTGHARDRHGRIASEMLAHAVVKRATRRATGLPPRERPINVGVYVASVELGLGTARVCRAIEMWKPQARRTIRRLEDLRDRDDYDRVLTSAAAGALA